MQEATNHRSFGSEIDVVELLIIYFLPIHIATATVGKDEKKNCCNSFAHGVRFAGF